jgi:hypothetical protein
MDPKTASLVARFNSASWPTAINGQDNSAAFFTIDGLVVRVSTAILCQCSPVFHSMFCDGQFDDEPISLTDCSMTAFVEFLQCIYPDCFVELTAEVVLNIFPIAHKFDVPAVQAKCIAWVKVQAEFSRLDLFGQLSLSLDAAILIDSLVGPMAQWDDDVHARLLKGVMGDGGLFEINVKHIQSLRPETMQRMLTHCMADEATRAACFGLNELNDMPCGMPPCGLAAVAQTQIRGTRHSRPVWRAEHQRLV